MLIRIQTMSNRIVLVTGSRGWTDKNIIKQEFVKLVQENLDVSEWVLVHGACRGADLISAEVAIELGWKLIGMPVTSKAWQTYGKRAGIMRNTEMIQEHKPHHAFAFQVGDSPGTNHCIREVNRYMNQNNSRMMESIRCTRI